MPIKPIGQLQTGLWWITIHCALIPHDPGQGSRQCWLIQDRSKGQSELVRHSGLHNGLIWADGPPQGSQTAIIPAWTVHCTPGPQGDGLHGNVSVIWSCAKNNHQHLDQFWALILELNK